MQINVQRGPHAWNILRFPTRAPDQFPGENSDLSRVYAKINIALWGRMDYPNLTGPLPDHTVEINLQCRRSKLTFGPVD